MQPRRSINFRVPEHSAELIEQAKAAAASVKRSLSSWILIAIREKLERDKEANT